jgi:4-nitrophenyl phosphatase
MADKAGWQSLSGLFVEKAPHMLSSLSPEIKAVILDMDGVLWKDSQPIGDLPAIFSRIRSLGLNFILATNNAVRSVEQHQEKLAQFGVFVEDWQVVNSGMAVAFLLSQQFPHGGPVYVVGEPGLVSTLASQGFHQAEENVIAVVAGYDRQITFTKLSKATALVRKGAPFYGTNPDKTFPTPEGLGPGAGAFLAFLEASTGIKPIIAGKPYPTLYNLAIRRLGLPANQILAIGDRLDTDILGAQQVGCRTGLVLSGVTSKHELDQWSPAPDIVSPDLRSMLD